MGFKEQRESLERFANRVHLVWWIADGAASLVSGIVSGWLAHIHGWSWLVVILAAVGGFVVASLAVTLAIWLVARLGGTRPTICIIFGEGVPFDTFRNRLHSRERRIRVCVENRSRSQKLTNCFLELTSISGALAPRCPIKIKSDFTLNPHSEVYVAIASFKETGSKPAVSDLIRLYFPINELSDGRSYLEDASPHELCFTASAAESAPHIKNAILWIDGGVLKLEETRE